MVRADEEARSRLFWAQQERRKRAKAAFRRSIRGSDAAATQVRADWEPVILARLEARLVERNDEDE